MLTVDGEKVEHKISTLVIPDVGDIELARDSTIVAISENPVQSESITCVLDLPISFQKI